MPPAAILDVDGTLVDTNYHHAIAWYRAFRQSEVLLPIWRIHRHIGMGGDQLVEALGGEQLEKEKGDDIRAAESVLYGELMSEVEPLEGARDLIVDLKERGHAVVLASSARSTRSSTTSSCSTPGSWRTTGPRRTTWRPRSRSPISSSPRWRRPAAGRR
jgi:beta-phosphoglucomutase-like phosphatase (HAD superfamily)